MDALTLAINNGSSSQEYAVFKGSQRLMNAYYELSGDDFLLTIDQSPSQSVSKDDFANSLDHFLGLIKEAQDVNSEDIAAVGVRIVVPGTQFNHHQLLTDDVLKKLQSMLDESPLHLVTELAQIENVRLSIPTAKIYLLSDTAFHKTIPAAHRHYAIDKADSEQFDVHRFGYHGLSMQSVTRTINANFGSVKHEKMIVCHLGGGASITAIENGQSINNSMGYSPFEGLVMATRSGDVDIEVALEIKRKKGFNDKELIAYLTKKSGLLGLSGKSNDIRELLKLEAEDDDAKLALEVMVERVVAYIGSYWAQLGGLDLLVFTATVGERSVPIRQRICQKLEALGVIVDEQINQSTDTKQQIISRSDSKVNVAVIPTDETTEIALQTNKLYGTED